MFTLFVPYLICICIFYLICQLNALNGFHFQLLIYAISAIKKKNSKKDTNYLFILMALFHCMVRYGSARLGTVRYGSVRVGCISTAV